MFHLQFPFPFLGTEFCVHSWACPLTNPIQRWPNHKLWCVSSFFQCMFWLFNKSPQTQTEFLMLVMFSPFHLLPTVIPFRSHALLILASLPSTKSIFDIYSRKFCFLWMPHGIKESSFVWIYYNTAKWVSDWNCPIFSFCNISRYYLWLIRISSYLDLQFCTMFFRIIIILSFLLPICFGFLF